MEGYNKFVNSVAFSVDGQCVVSGLTESVRIYDVSTGRELQKLVVDHSGWVNSVAFSADGQRVVSGMSDGSVRVWDTPTRMGNYDTERKSDPEGWLISKRHNHRLIWLPVHLHPGLCNEYTRLLISRNPHTMVDFASACLGSDWTRCYIGSER